MKKYLIFLLAVCTACSAQNRMISSMETAESSRSEEERSLIETAQKTEETPVTEETAEGIDIDAYTGNWEGLVDVLSMKETSENVYEADGLTVSWSTIPIIRISGFSPFKTQETEMSCFAGAEQGIQQNNLIKMSQGTGGIGHMISMKQSCMQSISEIRCMY